MRRPERSARAGRRLIAGTTAALAVAVLPAVAVAQSDTDIHLLRLDREDGRIAVGPPTAVTDRAGYDNQPAFTPDGRLLYTSIRGGQADTYRYDPETGRTARVTATAESEYSPTPIPGSSRFSVVRVEADSTQRLWSFAADGTAPRLVLEEVAPVGYHAWSGDRLALFVLGDPPTLRVADLAGGAVRVAARDIGRSLQPVPDRDAVSFTQRTDDGWLLREVRLSDDAIRTLARLLGPDEYHAWTPTGEILTAHGTELFQLDRASGEWRTVADVSRHGLGAITRLAVSADGGALAIVVERSAETSGDGG